MNNLRKIAGFNVKARCELLCISCQRMVPSRQYSDDINFLPSTDPSSFKRGRGGRSSFSGVVCTVFGSTGFFGRILVNRLGKLGTQVILPYRVDAYDVAHLKLMGDLGQILFLPFHLCDEESIRKSVKYSNVVVNLIGRDYESRNFNFHQVHVEGARRVARICKEMGVKKFIHVSALNSDAEDEGYFSPAGSMFLKTKGEGEEAVKEYYPDAIIFRPSDMYGQGDRFLFYYGHLFRYQDVNIALPRGGNGIWKQPLYVGDLAKGIVNAVYNPNVYGQTYQAIGPRRYELKELVEWFMRVTRRREEWGTKVYDMKWDPTYSLRLKINTKISMSNPVNNMTTDRLERENVSDTVSEDLPTLEDLGVDVAKMEDTITYQLGVFKAKAYYFESLGEYEKPTPPPFIDPNDDDD